MGNSYRDVLLRSVAAAALLSCTAAVAARAQDAYGNFTGFSVYGGGGIGMFNTGVQGTTSRSDLLRQCAGARCPPIKDFPFLEELPPGSTFQTFGDQFNINDLGGDGGFGTVGAAYDFRLGERWTLGAYVDADWLGMDADASHQNGFNVTNTAFPLVGFGDVTFGEFGLVSEKVTVDPNWDINAGLKLGWRAWPNTLLYFSGGYSHIDLDSRVKVSTDAWFFQNTGEYVPLQLVDGVRGGCQVFAEELPPTGIGSPGGCPLNFNLKGPSSADGFHLAFGGETQIGNSQNWFLRLEGRWQHYDLSVKKSDFARDSADVCVAAGSSVCYTTVGRDSAAWADAQWDNLDVVTARVALVYRFGGGYVEPAPLK